jgi:hypothetical protein
MSRKRGRPHKHPVEETMHMEPVEAVEPAEISIRLGLRPVATSKGRSDGTNRFVVPGAVVKLPRHEAENLVNMGYAARV